MTGFNAMSRAALLAGAALAGFAPCDAAARAESATAQPAATAATARAQDSAADARSGPIEERQSYVLRAMAQLYDGREDLSHTQVIGIGRVRKGNRSITQFDYGDGAVVIVPDEGKVAASRFLNITGTERRVVYEYDTKRVRGDRELAGFHNAVVRPLLGKGPQLGSDVQWSASVPLGALDVLGLADQGATAKVGMTLSRTYFSHDGLDMVLIEYAIPAFSYAGRDGAGAFVQWGRGFALTDPGFGMIYLNAALHRAVETRPGAPARPYRFARSMVAANPDGSAMIDYREIPQLAGVIEPVLGAEAMRIVPVDDGDLPANGLPLEIGRRLDMVALAIGEDGANETMLGAGTQTGDGRGLEVSGQIVGQLRDALARALGTSAEEVPPEVVGAAVRELGARAMTGALDPAFASGPAGSRALAQERTNSVSGPGGSTGLSEAEAQAVRAATDAIMRLNGSGATGGQGSTGASLGDEVSAETLDALQNSTGEGLRGFDSEGDSSQLFGGQGEDDKTAADTVSGGLTAGQYAADKANAITAGLVETRTVRLAELAKGFGNELDSAADRYRQANARLKAQGKSTIKILPRAQLRLDNIIALNNEKAGVEKKLDSLSGYIADLTRQGGAISDDLLREAGDLVLEYNALHDRSEAQFKAFNAIPAADRYYVAFDETDAFTRRMLASVEDSGRELGQLERMADALGAEYGELHRLVGKLPTEKVGELIERFGNSPAGRILDGVSHGLNAWTIGQSLHGTIDAAYNNKAKGDLRLARDHKISSLALDLAALAGNGLSGNVPAFLSDAAAITLGSVSDIFVSGKALRDTHRLNRELLAQTREMDARLSAMRTERIAGLGTLLEEAGAQMETLEDEIEESVRRAEQLREERRRAQEELARLRQEEERRRRERERLAREERERREAENERRRSAQGRFENEFEPGYPTRDPSRTPANTRPVGTILGDPSTMPSDVLDEIERDKRREAARLALEKYQRETLERLKRERENSPAGNGGSDILLSDLAISDLLVSEFDLEPVTFEGVTFEPVGFDADGDLFYIDENGETKLKKVGPDDFEMTPFDPPDITRFPPTDPDDTDGYPGTGQYPGFTFEGLSGTVATDLSKWEEWLALQDVRKLTQLALAAGYPNLASALADAENIIRLSQDTGYVQWSQRAPSCIGYGGCPHIIGVWGMKRSIVALGDILVQSRGIFSTGGFSDIGISGFDLAYILRDFGIQDGDLIDVEISQFGRTIQRIEGHFLTTAGDPFGVRLRQGVAQMVVTALNEGSASPNTAEVTIDDVVRGDAVQTYSLDTGQTAVLRIEANADPEPAPGTGPGTGTGTGRSALGLPPDRAAARRRVPPAAIVPGAPPVMRVRETAPRAPSAPGSRLSAPRAPTAPVRPR